MLPLSILPWNTPQGCSAPSFVWLHHCLYPISNNQTYLCRSFVDSSSSSLSLCVFLYKDSTTIASQRDVGHFIEYFETFLSMSVESAVGIFLKHSACSRQACPRHCTLRMIHPLVHSTERLVLGTQCSSKLM